MPHPDGGSRPNVAEKVVLTVVAVALTGMMFVAALVYWVGHWEDPDMSTTPPQNCQVGMPPPC